MSQSNSKADNAIAGKDVARASVLQVRGRRWRLLLMGLLTIVSTGLTGYSMFEIFRPNRFTELEMVQLGLAMVLFLWLTWSFWTSVIGFLLKLFHIDPISLRRELPSSDVNTPITQRHAIVMPVYNEDTDRIIVGFEACVNAILKTDYASQYDFYMLSDAQDTPLGRTCLMSHNLVPYCPPLSTRYRDRTVFSPLTCMAALYISAFPLQALHQEYQDLRK